MGDKKEPLVRLKKKTGSEATFELLDGTVVTYHLRATRSFWIDVTSLHVSDQIGSWGIGDDREPLGPFVSSLSATAILQEPIAVIGDPKTRKGFRKVRERQVANIACRLRRPGR